MRKLSCVSLLGVVICWPGFAAQMTVGDLLRFCTSSSELEKTACSFYIWGVAEGASLGASSMKDKSGTFREMQDKSFCLPEGVSKGALELVVRGKMGEDLAVFPQDRDLPAVSFVVAVITRQFPCGKAK